MTSVSSTSNPKGFDVSIMGFKDMDTTFTKVREKHSWTLEESLAHQEAYYCSDLCCTPKGKDVHRIVIPAGSSNSAVSEIFRSYVSNKRNFFKNTPNFAWYVCDICDAEELNCIGASVERTYRFTVSGVYPEESAARPIGMDADIEETDEKEAFSEKSSEQATGVSSSVVQLSGWGPRCSLSDMPVKEINKLLKEKLEENGYEKVKVRDYDDVMGGYCLGNSSVTFSLNASAEEMAEEFYKLAKNAFDTPPDSSRVLRTFAVFQVSENRDLGLRTCSFGLVGK